MTDGGGYSWHEDWGNGSVCVDYPAIYDLNCIDGAWTLTSTRADSGQQDTQAVTWSGTTPNRVSDPVSFPVWLCFSGTNQATLTECE